MKFDLNVASRRWLFGTGAGLLLASLESIVIGLHLNVMVMHGLCGMIGALVSDLDAWKSSTGEVS